MTDVEITFNFDEAALRAFEDGDVDPSVGARIRVGETYVVGDEDGYAREFIEVFVIGLLEGSLAALDDERYVLDYYIDEMYLVFEPIDDRVRLAFCYTEAAVNDRDRLGERFPDNEATACKDALVDAVLEAAETYLEVVREYDSSAGEDHVTPLLRELRAATEEQ